MNEITKSIPDEASISDQLADMDEDELRRRLEQLRIEHRDLDAAIDALANYQNARAQVERLTARAPNGGNQ